MKALPPLMYTKRAVWDEFLTSVSPPLNAAERGAFAKKRILITGAGGYLGSALARRLAKLAVGSLVLLDRAEYGLYRLDQDLRAAGQTSPTSLVVGSVCDRALLRKIFAQQAPELVFHAAALKHVPLMETNALAAAETNVLGTEALVEAAGAAQVESFVHLSTDKAVDPVSIMGATKRLAEQIVLQAQKSNQSFRAVRLCNVLGSTGSVAPLFVRQIRRGGPVTLTHAEATRFFITRAEAVRSLLRAAIHPSHAGLLVPALGQPRRVQELAEFLVQRLRPAGSHIEIVLTGLRAGEKLHEELISASERIGRSTVPSFVAVTSPFDHIALRQGIAAMRLACATYDEQRVLQALQSVLPSFGRQDMQDKVAAELSA